MDLEFPIQIASNGEAVITITEDLDTESAGEALRIAFNSLMEKDKKYVTLDMSQVEIINSYGIGKILICNKTLKEGGGKLTVLSVHGFVEEVFKLLMLDNLFEMK